MAEDPYLPPSGELSSATPVVPWYARVVLSAACITAAVFGMSLFQDFPGTDVYPLIRRLIGTTVLSAPVAVPVAWIIRRSMRALVLVSLLVAVLLPLIIQLS